MVPRYINNIHTHASFTGFGQELPYQIALHTGDRVWIHASSMEDYPMGVEQVFDNHSYGLDENGDCILSFPVELVKRYYDVVDVRQEMEANAVEREMARSL